MQYVSNTAASRGTNRYKFSLRIEGEPALIHVVNAKSRGLSSAYDANKDFVSCKLQQKLCKLDAGAAQQVDAGAELRVTRSAGGRACGAQQTAQQHVPQYVPDYQAALDAEHHQAANIAPGQAAAAAQQEAQQPAVQYGVTANSLPKQAAALAQQQPAVDQAGHDVTARAVLLAQQHDAIPAQTGAVAQAPAVADAQQSPAPRRLHDKHAQLVSIAPQPEVFDSGAHEEVGDEQGPEGLVWYPQGMQGRQKCQPRTANAAGQNTRTAAVANAQPPAGKQTKTMKVADLLNVQLHAAAATTTAVWTQAAHGTQQQASAQLSSQQQLPSRSGKEPVYNPASTKRVAQQHMMVAAQQARDTSSSRRRRVHFHAGPPRVHMIPGRVWTGLQATSSQRKRCSIGKPIEAHLVVIVCSLLVHHPGVEHML